MKVKRTTTFDFFISVALAVLGVIGWVNHHYISATILTVAFVVHLITTFIDMSRKGKEV